VLEVEWGEHMCMVKVKDLMKSEYVNLIPPLSNAEYERLKQSIKEWGGLLMPIILNQDDVVLDGYQRLMACKELDIPFSYSVKDFTDKPQDELEYIMAVNLHRRHLNELQRAKIALKLKKKVNRIAAERKRASQFTKESGKEAAMKRHHGFKAYSDTSRISLGSRTREQLAKYVNVSPATIARVDTILEEGSLEQKASLNVSGINTIYELVKLGKLQRRDSSALARSRRKHNSKLLNKDFRIVTQDQISDGSVDLVLVLNFPDEYETKDKGRRIYEQLMECASKWLKKSGLDLSVSDYETTDGRICPKGPSLLGIDIIDRFHLLFEDTKVVMRMRT
jgi:hypothetical protein